MTFRYYVTTPDGVEHHAETRDGFDSLVATLEVQFGTNAEFEYRASLQDDPQHIGHLLNPILASIHVAHSKGEECA